MSIRTVPECRDIVFRVESQDASRLVAEKLALRQVTVNEKDLASRSERIEIDVEREPESLGRVGPGHNKRDGAATGFQ